MNAEMARDFARLLKSKGFDCPEVRAVYKIGSDSRGRIMRLYCGIVGGPRIEDPSFRIHTTDSGLITLWVWSQ
jgi:hypothetical protein